METYHYSLIFLRIRFIYKIEHSGWDLLERFQTFYSILVRPAGLEPARLEVARA